MLSYHRRALSFFAVVTLLFFFVTWICYYQQFTLSLSLTHYHCHMWLNYIILNSVNRHENLLLCSFLSPVSKQYIPLSSINHKFEPIAQKKDRLIVYNKSDLAHPDTEAVSRYLSLFV